MPAGSADCGPSEGEVLVVTRLNRLARSTRDLLNLLGTIAEKGGLAVRLLPHDDAKLQFTRWPSVGIRILLKRNAVFA